MSQLICPKCSCNRLSVTRIQGYPNNFNILEPSTVSIECNTCFVKVELKTYVADVDNLLELATNIWKGIYDET